MQNVFPKACVGFAVLLSVAFIVGCATTGPPLFGANGYHPGPVPTGSSWVMERRDSGSFGSSTVQQTYRSLGEQTWQGKKVYAYDGPESMLLSELPSMKRVAYVKGTTPLFSYDPPLGHSYPLWVGKTWEEINQITFHRMGSTFGVLTKWKVEA